MSQIKAEPGSVVPIESIMPPNDNPRSAHLFATEHLKKGIEIRSARGGVVTIATQFVMFVVQMGTTMVLARLLVPADFGLVAMVTAVTGFIQVFKDGGLSMATVQQKTISHEQISVLFWLNLILSIALALVAVVIAPLISLVFAEPRLTWITCIIATTFFVSGTAIQHKALLKRQMQFGRLALVSLFARVVGSLVAIGFAWQLRSYWALVAMPVATVVADAMASWAVCRWMPGLPRRGTGVMPMVRFGSNLMGASGLNYLSRNADNFIIGYMSGPGSLGIYTKAYGLLLLPLQQFLAPISAVTIPALSRLVDDPPAFRKFFLQQGRLVISASGLVIVFSCCAAVELVWFVLGDGWEQAAVIFWLLSPGAFISMTNISGLWVCTTHGHTDRQRKIATVAAPVYVVSFLIGSNWGAEGVAAAYSIACVLMRHPVFVYALRDLPINPPDIWLLTVRPLVLGLPLVAASLAIYQLFSLSPIQSLAAKILILVLTVLIGVLIGWLPDPRRLKAMLSKSPEKSINRAKA